MVNMPPHYKHKAGLMFMSNSEIERLQKRLEDMERKLTAAQSSSLYKTG